MKKETKISQVINMALSVGAGGKLFTVRYLHSKLPHIGKNTISSYMGVFYESYPNNLFRRLRTKKKQSRGSYKYYEYEFNGVIHGFDKDKIVQKVSTNMYKKNTESKKKAVTTNEYPVYWYVANIMLTYMMKGKSFTTSDVLEEIKFILPNITKLRHITSYVTDIYRLSKGNITRVRPGSSYVYTGNTDYYKSVFYSWDTPANIPFMMYDKQPTNVSTKTFTKDQAVEDFVKVGGTQAERMSKIQTSTISQLRKAIEQLKNANDELTIALQQAPDPEDVWKMEGLIHSLKSDKTRLTVTNTAMMKQINDLTGTGIQSRNIRIELPANAENGFVGAAAHARLSAGKLHIDLTVNNIKHQWYTSKQELSTKPSEISKPPKHPPIIVDGFTFEQYKEAGWTEEQMKATVDGTFMPFIKAGLIK